MSEKETGGPAFPKLRREWEHGVEGFHYVFEGGMTLRDVFAKDAPISFYDARNIWSDVNMQYRKDPKISEVIKTLVELRYQYADAMLKERAK